MADSLKINKIQNHSVISTKTVKTIGYLVVLLSVCFVIRKIWLNKDFLSGLTPSPQLFIIVFFSSTVFILLCVFMASGWYRLLLFFGQEDANFKNCYIIYARSQIARYLPGNIFHLPIRHAAGINIGYDNGPLAGAALYEILGILFSSITLVLIGYLFFDVSHQEMPLFKVGLIFICAAIFPVLFNNVAHRIPFLEKLYFPKKNFVQIISGLFPAYFFYYLFLLTLAGLFLYVVHATTSFSDIGQSGLIVTGFVFAVLAGFITPGAPGGLGVREAIIVYFLAGLIGESESLLVALLFRVINILGELLVFLSSFMLGSSLTKS